MEKTRVAYGQRYWYITLYPDGTIETEWLLEEREIEDDNHYRTGNYFHTQEEAEACARKLRAVLKGAEVIDMPSEEEFEKYLNEHFPYNGGTKGMICEATKGEWRLCFKWLKSKIVK